MSLLVSMEIRWKLDGEASGFEYLSIDYVIKGYSGQDSVLVSVVINLNVDIVQDRHPAAKKFIIQSDNTSAFASQELIPSILNMNTRLDVKRNVVLSRWIFTESQTGKIPLYTHY